MHTPLKSAQATYRLQCTVSTLVAYAVRACARACTHRRRSTHAHACAHTGNAHFRRRVIDTRAGPGLRMGAHCQGQAAGQRTNMLLTMQCNNMLLTVQRDNVLLGAQCSQHTAGSAVEQQAAGGAAQQHAPDGAGLLCARPCRHGWPPSGWSP